MRRILAFVSLLFLVLAPMGAGAPLTGAWFMAEEIGSEPFKKTTRFRGGERAVVLVAGKNHETARLHLAIYDVHGKLVAEDTGKDPPVGDMVGVIWYPPRDADYRIEIKNLDSRANRCFVTIK